MKDAHAVDDEPEAGGEALQILAHDLGNHAVAALVNLELLERQVAGSLNEAHRRAVVSAQDRLRSILSLLTADVPDLERLVSGRLELSRARFDLRDAVATGMRLSRNVAQPKRLRFALRHADAPLPVEGDHGRLVRVLQNLVAHAASRSPEGGRIEVSCAPAPAGQVRVAVSDEGPPVAASNGRRRRDVAPRGGGIGLHFCRQIILAHGGRLWIESPVHGSAHGARSCFALPAAPLVP